MEKIEKIEKIVKPWLKSQGLHFENIISLYEDNNFCYLHIDVYNDENQYKELIILINTRYNTIINVFQPI